MLSVGKLPDALDQKRDLTALVPAPRPHEPAEHSDVENRVEGHL